VPNNEKTSNKTEQLLQTHKINSMV